MEKNYAATHITLTFILIYIYNEMQQVRVKDVHKPAPSSTNTCAFTLRKFWNLISNLFQNNIYLMKYCKCVLKMCISMQQA